jgi:alginate O-acetyltransferase complex protein AlgI
MQMMWGFFKKVVIADRMVMFVDFAYNQPQNQNGLTLLMATFFFTFQIYCDFSGYSDIALGAAKVMGFDLMKNFDFPYKAQSISEFWRRWHISLSTWFRDYLYIPLGGNRKSFFRNSLNLIIVFTASGLWHGAKWTFIVWGLLHGIYLVAAQIRDKYLLKKQYEGSNLSQAFDVFLTFVLVMLTWIFFRANSLSDALLILERISQTSFFETIDSNLNKIEMAFCIILLLILLVKEHFLPIISTKNTKSFYVLMALFIVSIYLFGVFNQSQFIYFQF